MQALIEKLKLELIESLHLEDLSPAEIDPEASLFEDGLGLDSIDVLELVVMLEKSYGIKVTDMEQGKSAFRSLSSLAAFITEQRDQCNESG